MTEIFIDKGTAPFESLFAILPEAVKVAVGRIGGIVELDPLKKEDIGGNFMFEKKRSGREQ